MAADGTDRATAEARFLAGKQPTGRFVEAAAIAAMVAVTVAMGEATTAMSAERIVASCTWVFCQAEWNQRSEKPDQTATLSPALKA